jgi:tyrosinase
VAGEWQFAHETNMEGDDHAHATPVAAENGDIVLGTMSANTSLNDPVFWLHHVNIDRLWNVWMERHGASYLPETGGALGHNIDDHMWPYEGIGVEATPRLMLDSSVLGYRYDTDAAQ